MPHCDECDTDARQVWRHRAFETETRRTVQWVCRACHPDLRTETVAYEPISPETTEGTDETVATEETGETAELRSDGGQPAGVAAVSASSGPTAGTRCPVCLGDTVSGQGLYDCVDCEWTGPL
jgi:hypothetical protein